MSELTLGYQRDIYIEFVNDSGLLVLGEGLGSWELFKSFIECYADPKVLVFVLGLEPEEEDELTVQFTAGFGELVGQVPFSVIKNDTLGSERVRIYSNGGVISVTSRIMLTDILTGRLPVFLTTGICVYRAERTTENCLEAFILHLFREQNQEGFIKAISEAPEPFTLGFNQLEKMMKWMRLPNTALLYPRFHSHIKDELDESGLEIEELVLKPSQRTTIVQMALVSLIESCLKELVKLNPFLETVSLGQEGESMATLDALLGRQFDVLVKQQLEPVWHQIGFRTRQLVSELGTLRSLLQYTR
jgi:DNA excision repair protein ERCC-4